MNPVLTYYRKLEATHASGAATEHSYRSALQELLQALDSNIEVINEPKQAKFGAPDLVLQRDGLPIGYVECKDLHIDLDIAARSEQLERYCAACDNLILTNYLEFRWFHGGEWHDRQSFAELREGKLHNINHRNTKFRSFLEIFLRAAPMDIRSPDELAQVMAILTGEIAAQIRAILDEPDRKTFLWEHKHDLEIALLPTLSNAKFADMYAQTIAYALFAARMELQHLPAAEFTIARAFTEMPRTNPFLHREFGQILQDLERDVKWAVEQLTTRLAHTQIDEVMQGFRGRTEQRDAVVHFYEDFLATYDPVMREQRGVYFTPEPVVGYIVRSVDLLLRSHFGRRDGLASDDVHILDPATGTGSFLLAVVEQIHETMRGQRGIWPDYVHRQLLPRLHGFELLMAPYTLAHLRLGRHLAEVTRFKLGDGERLSIYLTNALEEIKAREERLEGEFRDYIETEAVAAAEVKSKIPIMVVLGNPPYSGHSANKKIPWIQSKLQDYFEVDGISLKERNPKWLQDDYVKFIRFGQHQITRNDKGVLAFITNHSYIDNRTFPGMRQQLLNAFSEIYILDLHGNTRREEKTPEGNKDENVFAIQQGVSIAFFVKQRGHNGPARLFHADLWGLREEKYAALDAGDIEDTSWQEIEPQSPFYFFESFDYAGWRKYDSNGWDVTKIFPVHSAGIVTGDDELLVDFDRESLKQRIAGKFSNLTKEQDWERYIQPCLYRPFDVRFLFYHPKLIERTRQNVMQHMCHGEIEIANCTEANLGLVTIRQQAGNKPWLHSGVASTLIESSCISNKTREINYLFPLYHYSFLYERVANFSNDFLDDCKAKLGLRFVEETTGEANTVSPPKTSSTISTPSSIRRNIASTTPNSSGLTFPMCP